MTKKLFIIAIEKISAWIDKGEVVSRYYNPGNLFDEVHIMMLNNDQPRPDLVQPMVGKAKLFLYNYPEPENFFRRTLGWWPFLMDGWAKGAIEIAQEINPNLIRCHGAHLNIFLAAKIKKVLGVPYVISLHTNPDENCRRYAENFKQKLIGYAVRKVENFGLKNASFIMPVYQPIVPYLESRKIKNYKVCYNVTNGNITFKASYNLSNPVKIISVGRLIKGKNPINIIKAISGINAHLTIVGMGPLKKDLETYVNEKNLNTKVEFIDSISNDKLCVQLHTYDIVALHTEYYEFSKVFIEASLAGMPIVINWRSDRKQVPEFEFNNCLRVDNSEEGYLSALKALLSDELLRARLGQNARLFCEKECLPEVAENNYVKIYKTYMK